MCSCSCVCFPFSLLPPSFLTSPLKNENLFPKNTRHGAPTSSHVGLGPRLRSSLGGGGGGGEAKGGAYYQPDPGGVAQPSGGRVRGLCFRAQSDGHRFVQRGGVQEESPGTPLGPALRPRPARVLPPLTACDRACTVTLVRFAVALSVSSILPSCLPFTQQLRAVNTLPYPRRPTPFYLPTLFLSPCPSTAPSTQSSAPSSPSAPSVLTLPPRTPSSTPH
jgi:hypothetical protein